MSKPYGILLDRTLRVIKQDLISRFREEGISLTPEQWPLLQTLWEEDKMHQKELGDRTFKDAPTISRIVQLLETNAYIKRTADQLDRRKTWIELTALGKEVVRRALPIVELSRKSGWEMLSQEDYDHLHRILAQVHRNLS